MSGPRVLIIDEKGHMVDGDQLMAVVAQSWQTDGRLAGPGKTIGIEGIGVLPNLRIAMSEVGTDGDTDARGNLEFTDLMGFGRHPFNIPDRWVKPQRLAIHMAQVGKLAQGAGRI